MFDKLYIEDRNAKVGVSKTYLFKYIGNGTIRLLPDGTQDISKSTCGCQIQEYNSATRTISAIVTPKPIPLNRITKGFNNYEKIVQVIAVFMENGHPKQYILTISLTIYE